MSHIYDRRSKQIFQLCDSTPVSDEAKYDLYVSEMSAAHTSE